MLYLSNTCNNLMTNGQGNELTFHAGVRNASNNQAGRPPSICEAARFARQTPQALIGSVEIPSVSSSGPSCASYSREHKVELR
jgi:hypothetical protein